MNMIIYRLASQHFLQAKKRLVKLRVETCATFATIFVATTVRVMACRVYIIYGTWREYCDDVLHIQYSVHHRTQMTCKF